MVSVDVKHHIYLLTYLVAGNTSKRNVTLDGRILNAGDSCSKTSVSFGVTVTLLNHHAGPFRQSGAVTETANRLSDTGK